MTKKRTLQILAVFWVIAFVLGVIGLAQKFATGERLAGYGSYVPWGLWVALYFHGVGIAGGVFTVGVAGYLFGVAGLREHLRVTLWVSAVAMATGLLAIWLDIGQPRRIYRLLTAPSFTSMMAFNAWLYWAFLAMLAVSFGLSFRKASPRALNDRSGWLVPLLLVGLVMAVVFPSQGGAFLGVVDAKPHWNSALMPVLFLCSAVAAGAAVLLLVHTFLLPENMPPTEPPLKMLRRVTLGATIFYLGAEFAEFSIAYWMPHGEHRQAFDLVLFGPFWWVFWIVHLGGALMAILLLLRGHSLPAVGAGAFLVALTFVSTRLNILIPGQSVTELKGLQGAFHHSRLSHYYVATLNEYLVAMFIGALGVGLVYLGVAALRRFSMPTEAKKHHERQG